MPDDRTNIVLRYEIIKLLLQIDYDYMKVL